MVDSRTNPHKTARKPNTHSSQTMTILSFKTFLDSNVQSSHQNYRKSVCFNVQTIKTSDELRLHLLPKDPDQL